VVPRLRLLSASNRWNDAPSCAKGVTPFAHDGASFQRLLAESNRSLGVTAYAHDGAALQRLLAESNRSLGVTPFAHDGASFQRLLAESNRSLGTTPYAYDGAALQRLLAESNRSLGVTPYGTDEAGNFDRLRTDPDRILWTRDRRNYTTFNSTLLTTTANTLIFNLGSTAAELYELWFEVVNISGSAAGTYRLGIDVGGAGTLSLGEYIRFDEVVSARGATGWFGPYLANGNDDVRGSAGATSTLTIHTRVERVDVGA